jgi:hypothetical protein
MLGLAQPAAPALGRGQLGRQLVAARLAVELILGRVDGLGLLKDLARDLLVVEVLIATGVGIDLGPVDRDQLDARQPRLRAQAQDLTEQAGQRMLVTLDEPRDGGVVGLLLGGDHPISDVLLARALDRPRGPHPTRVGVEHQGHQVDSTGCRNAGR